MPARTSKPQGRRHQAYSFRLPDLTLTRLKPIADALNPSQAGPINAAAYFALKDLGLLREDIAGAIDSLERVHGPDGMLIAILEQYEEADDGVTSYVAVVATAADTPPGADLQELEDWS